MSALDPIERLLTDMITAIDNIDRYATGRAVFDSNELIRGWTEYQLILLGEAARRVGETDRSYQETHPEVPWGQLIGMRNVLIHRYHRVDRDIVWTAVTADLPSIRASLDQLLTPEVQRNRPVDPSRPTP